MPSEEPGAVAVTRLRRSITLMPCCCRRSSKVSAAICTRSVCSTSSCKFPLIYRTWSQNYSCWIVNLIEGTRIQATSAPIFPDSTYLYGTRSSVSTGETISASSNWYGASLGAFQSLLGAAGYRLVACNLIGVNAFFVRAEFAERFADVPAEWQELYMPAAYLPYPWLGHPRSRRLIESLIA